MCGSERLPWGSNARRTDQVGGAVRGPPRVHGLVLRLDGPPRRMPPVRPPDPQQQTPPGEPGAATRELGPPTGPNPGGATPRRFTAKAGSNGYVFEGSALMRRGRCAAPSAAVLPPPALRSYRSGPPTAREGCARLPKLACNLPVGADGCTSSSAPPSGSPGTVRETPEQRNALPTQPRLPASFSPSHPTASEEPLTALSPRARPQTACTGSRPRPRSSSRTGPRTESSGSSSCRTTPAATGTTLATAGRSWGPTDTPSTSRSTTWSWGSLGGRPSWRAVVLCFALCFALCLRMMHLPARSSRAARAAAANAKLRAGSRCPPS